MIIVPIAIKNVYTASPEDCRTITIIKTIYTVGSVIPPILIILANLYLILNYLFYL